MIFVTVGTTHGFDRLIRLVDSAVEKGILESDVFAQIGNGRYEPRHFRYARTLMRDEFDAHVQGASAIISHAGIGAIMTAIRFHKPAVVMPRRPELGEVVNEHQIATAREFGKRGQVLVANDETQLASLLRQLPSFVPAELENSADGIVHRIRSFLHDLNEVRAEESRHSR